MLRERFLSRGGSQADWDRRMAIPWSDVREEHRSLFAHDSVYDDAKTTTQVGAGMRPLP